MLQSRLTPKEKSIRRRNLEIEASLYILNNIDTSRIFTSSSGVIMIYSDKEDVIIEESEWGIYIRYMGEIPRATNWYDYYDEYVLSMRVLKKIRQEAGLETISLYRAKNDKISTV
jgi:hypothetical protein